MGPPPDPEQILQLLENPQFASTLNEALSNPQIIDQMIQGNPMLRESGPAMRQMLQSPEVRRFLTDPQMLRTTMQAQRAFGGGPFGGRGGNSAFPAPGATDTTPSGAQSSDGTGTQGQNQQQPLNPFAMFRGADGQAGNPFAQMFNNPAAFGSGGGNANPSTGSEGTNNNTNTGSNQGQQANNAFANPFLNPNLLPFMNAAAAAQQQSRSAGADTAGTGATESNAQANPWAALMGMMDPSAGGAGGNNNNSAGSNPYAFNPFAFPGAFGGMGGDAGASAAPQDSRPPEERYAEQLRQLNDMGFFEFERNVEALRRSGGSVHGAVEYLLTHPAP